MNIMRNLITIAAALSLAACGEPLKTENKTYPTYGILNENTSKFDNVCYEVSTGNVILSILLLESVVFPVYFIGFSMYNPTREKTSPTDNCKTS